MDIIYNLGCLQAWAKYVLDAWYLNMFGVRSWH